MKKKKKSFLKRIKDQFTPSHTIAEVPNLENFVGETVIIDGKPVVIETIVGNVGLTLGRKPEDMRPQFFEINGKYNISMLRFLAQMHGEEYTEEEYKAFEEMEFYVKPNEDKSHEKQSQ